MAISPAPNASGRGRRGRPSLTNLKARAEAGQALLNEGGVITDQTGFEPA